MDDDAELLRRYAVERSEEAFAELVRRHVDLVYSAALRRLHGDAHAAADVTQEVFIALARQAGKLAQYRALPPWLYATARNVAIDFVRSEQRRRTREQEAHLMQKVISTYPERNDWEQVRASLDTAMDELGSADRAALVLRFLARRSLAEVGVALGISEDAARMRVSRALTKLHGLLARRGVTSSAVAMSAGFAEQVITAAPSGLGRTVARAAVIAADAIMSPTWFGLVNSKTVATLLSAIVLCSSGAFALWQWRTLDSTHRELAAERAQIFSLARQVADVQRSTQERLLALLKRHPDALGSREREAATPEKEVNGPFGPTPPGSRARGRALMAAYPEIQRLVVQEKRASITARYGKLYLDLGLNATDIDAFEHILIAGVSSTFSNGDRTVTLDAAPTMSWAEKGKKLKHLLSERGFARMQAFEQPQSTRAASLASALYHTNHPLTAPQAVKIKQLLKELPRGTGRPAKYWEAFRDRAAEFLSPYQLPALRRLEAEDEFDFARLQNQNLRTETAANL